MTHDELLIKVDRKNHSGGEVISVAKLRKALRAVVELHKHIYVETEGGEFQLCADCSRRVSTPGYGVLYPCKTIQAIEKELG